MMKQSIARLVAAASFVVVCSGPALAQEQAPQPPAATSPTKGVIEAKPRPKDAPAPDTPSADSAPAATQAPGSDAPASQPPAATPAEITRTSIVAEAITSTPKRKPVVAYRYADDEPLKPLAVGTELKEGVTIQIGYHTAIRILVGDGQEFTFDKAGTYTITEAYNDGNIDITRMSVPIGRVSFDVKKVRYANDVIIDTPEMTLAIKGTSGAIEVAPGQPTVAVGAEYNRGRIETVNKRSQEIAVMTRNERVDTVVSDPASHLARRAVVDASTDPALERDESRASNRSEGSAQGAALEMSSISNNGRRTEQPRGVHIINPGTINPNLTLPSRPTGPISLKPLPLKPGSEIASINTRAFKDAAFNFRPLDMVANNARVAVMTGRAHSFNIGAINRMVQADAVRNLSQVPFTFNLPTNMMATPGAVISGTILPTMDSAEIGRTLAEFRTQYAPMQMTLTSPAE